jgi:hypothetical protein
MALVLAAAFLLLLAGPAGAAEVSATLEPAGGVRYGSGTTVRGAVTEAGVPLGAQPVVLEVRRYPFHGPWRPVVTGVTDADGGFSFTRALDRNHRLRVRHEPTGALSATLRAYVYPSFRLAFQELPDGAIRITQTYRVPRDVRLRRRTRFYVGPQTRRRAPLRAVVPTRRVRPGRYRAVARVRIPAAYGGRFRYVSCFPYSPGSGMGNPDRRCPPRRFPVG